MEVVDPGSSDGRIASLDGFIISRARSGDGFHSILDGESDELRHYGKVKSHIVSEGFRSGTRCWGRELSAGNFIYVVDVTVHKNRRQGIGSFVLQKLFESEYVQGNDTVISWPVSRDIPNEILNDFDRIGRTNFLGYSPNINHPSRCILPENDVKSLEERPDAIHEERRKNYPLHYAIVDQNTPDIAMVIKSFYDKDPASIHVPDDRGFLPVFVAVRAPNVHALNKLIEIGVAEDLNNMNNTDNTDNTEGVTPLEAVLDSMQSTREFCEAMLGTWAAMKLPADGASQLQFGCTCGQCSGGWLSPRMRFALECMVENILSNTFKSFYIGFTAIFEVIYKILNNDARTPKLQDIQRDTVFERGTSFYFSKGGRVEYALDAVTATAKEQSNLGDGTFYEAFGENKKLCSASRMRK
ncbi:ankyrin repeat family protein [Desarmillaria ectypa]|nr:ankyrin repeat family protein [Desarmillaria ectypa]